MDEKKMLLERMQDVNHKYTLFSMCNVRKYGLCHSVYDCDTCRVSIVFLDNKIHTFRCRLIGINGSEIRSKCEREKKLALLGKDALNKMIDNKICKIEFGKFDKYGRVLVRIITPDDDKYVDDKLLEQMVAVRYNGGSRKNINWEPLLIYHEI